MANFISNAGRFIAVAMAGAMLAGAANADPLAKQVFGAEKLPSATAPKVYGSYAKGCFGGGMAIATDGPTWQAMRLSRNRRWGHPEMIRLLEKFSRDATKVGWPGLLVGDISQPRGGPMTSGHASHQAGLDADIWFTPMPKKRMSHKEREEISATTMVQGTNENVRVNQKRWTDSRTRLLRLAATYPQVERIFVNPAIKKHLCETVSGDRAWLNKVRPIWGHDYHFHVRIKCPAGSPGCEPQASTGSGDGCGKELAWWFNPDLYKPPKNPGKPKPRPRDVMRMSALPKGCQAVAAAPSPESEALVTLGGPGPAPAEAVADAPVEAPADTSNAFSAAPKFPLPPKRPAAAVGD